MSRPPLIDIRNATVWRGSTRVFDGLDLRIEQHERVAVLGPNGAGKTSLLMLLNRELYPVDRPGSHVRILGRERWNVWELRRRIGFVSDDLHKRYTPTATALDVVASGFFGSVGVHGMLSGRLSAAERRIAASVLSELGIADLHDTPLARMSTGQQRRCLLGRALVHSPRTLVLDEPTAGLDLAATFEFLGRVRKLAARGRTIVLVSHHLSDIPPEIGRVVLIADGRVVADGDKASVLTPATLTEICGTPVEVIERDGYFLAWPGQSLKT